MSLSILRYFKNKLGSVKFEVKSRNRKVGTVKFDVTTGLSYDLICYNSTENHLLRIEFSDEHIIFLSLTIIWKWLKNDKMIGKASFHTILNLLND